MVCPLAAWGQDVWDGTADVTWYKDSESSFEITTPEQLAGLAQLVNEGTEDFKDKIIKLDEDIRLNETSNWESWDDTNKPDNEWTAIGTDAKLFKGTFDGQNHTISGIYISNSNDNQGLFGYVYDGMIQNLSVADSYIQARNYVGGIVGYNNNGTVSNCSNSGTVTGVQIVGGIVGYSSGSGSGGKVSNCSNSGTVTGTLWAGGIVGYTEFNGDVLNCSNSGTVTGGEAVGGVVGHNGVKRGTVSNCSNSGTVTGSGVGGIVGENVATVSDCYYMEKEGLQGVGSGSGTSTNVKSKTPEEYESGEVARLLDETGEIWGQDFDKGYPVPLGSLSEEERKACKIYSVTFTYTLPVEGAEEKTITLYGNSDTPLVAPEETAVEGYAVTWTPELPVTFGTENPTFTATFTKLYTLTITQPTKGGTISATVGETPVEEGKGEVAKGATVTLEATPAAGYKLVEWDVKKSDGGEAVTVTDNKFTMPAGDVVVTATFQAIDYSVTISETTNGTVTADKETANIGEEVTLTVTPDAGYTLDVLTVKSGEATITVTDNKFTMPAGNVTVTATFEKKPEPEPEPEPTPDPEPTYYRVDLRPVEGATIVPSTQWVEEGGTLTFTIEIEEGYVADGMVVTVSLGAGKAVEVEPDAAGVYTVRDVDGRVTITVYGVEEAAPVGVETIEGVRVYSYEGAIYVHTPTEKRVMIVAMNGVLKANGEQVGKRRYELPRGFYVVWVDGASFKVAN